jgi:hypothetical protein
MPENMQADVPQSRQAVFVRCCPKKGGEMSAFAAVFFFSPFLWFPLCKRQEVTNKLKVTIE